MTCSTRSRVSSLSNGDRLITRLTVFFDTPDKRATSLIVGLPVRRLPRARCSSALVLKLFSPSHALSDARPRRKFGCPIGELTAAAGAGGHVHTHNLKTLLSGVEGYSYAPAATEPLGIAETQSFGGYRREDGRVGTRNEIWILPTVGCVGRTAQKIAAIAGARHARHVDGVHAFAHPFGCSQLGDDLAGTRSVLAALACHPNAGGVLIV